MMSDKNMKAYWRNYIGGQWVDGKKGRRIAVENPERVVLGKDLIDMELGEMPVSIRRKRIGGIRRVWQRLKGKNSALSDEL